MPSAVKNLEILLFYWNDKLSGKQVGTRASRTDSRQLAWIQPVYISINQFPTHKGLSVFKQLSV